MKIYTRTGDGGQTGLVGGARVGKHHPRVAAYGEVDELNCALGAVLAALQEGPVRKTLARAQEELFAVGALLACESVEAGRLPAPYDKGLPEAPTKALEADIDALSAGLPELKTFILPGGTQAGAALHLARAVCRRAERAAVGLPEAPAGVVPYLNRLSDYLFMAARAVNAQGGRLETPWLGLGK